MPTRAAVLLALALALVAGCNGAIDTRRDAAVDSGAPADAGLDASADAGPTDLGVTPSDLGADLPFTGTDDAVIVSALLPHAIGCTAHMNAVISVMNTGTSTWTAADGYALRAVGDSDPFHTASATEALTAGETVPPGATRDFTVPLVSTGVAGTVTTDWQMSHAGYGFFGGVASQDVLVSCDTVTVADFDLASVNVVASPDVRGFALTSHITSLSFSPGTIHVDHEKRGMWPPVVIAPDGTTQEATIWVFFHIGGAWYATGGERLRPDQTDKALDNPSQIGPGWLYDPGRWGIMTGYVPSPGDLVGFMVVAGSTRSDDNVIAMERTGVVLVPFPSDDVTTAFPPFAWSE